MSAKRGLEVAAGLARRAGASRSRSRPPRRCPCSSDASATTSTRDADRSDEARLGAERVAGSPPRSPGRNGVPSAFWSLISFSAVVAAHQRQLHRAVLLHDGQRLEQRGGVDAEQCRRPPRSCARPASPRAPARRAARGTSGCRRRPRRDLDVRGVAGVRERDLVLAGRAGRHVLVRARGRPSSRRPTRPCTSAARSGRRCGRRPRRAGGRTRRGPPRRGRSCRSPS